MYFHRNLFSRVVSSLENSPVVLLVGPRQSGKTSLITKITQENEYDFISFDNITIQAAALEDPVGFLSARKKPVIIDEVQRVPEIFLPIKVDVDQNRSLNGRYGLTGSVNPLLVPKLGDSLAGRMLLLQLWPLSQGELEGTQETFLNRVFDEDFGYSRMVSFSKKDLLHRVCLGGFPGMHAAKSEAHRRDWCNSYLSLVTQKDVRELAQIEGFTALPKLLQVIATRVGSTINYSDVANTTDIPLTSLRRYMQLLHSLFLVHSIPAWSRNLGKRLSKANKAYFIDTGVLLHTLDFNEERLEQTPSLLGGIAENFVVNELCKQASWNASKNIKIFYCRMSDNRSEVDIVLEDERGRVVGIEVKTSETVRSDDCKHLKQLQQLVGSDFVRGIVLYAGNEKLPFGSGMWAVPISDLWSL